MSVESGFVASANGSGAAEHSGDGAAPATPAAAVALLRERPEVLVGAAFAGGMVVAFLLRRLGR